MNHSPVSTIRHRMKYLSAWMMLVSASESFVHRRTANNFHERQFIKISTCPNMSKVSSGDKFEGSFDNQLQRNNNNNKIPSNQRRAFLLNSLLFSLLSPNNANSACLPGDIRSECIGIYKLPLDDGVLKYVETEEMLKKFAPDLKWVRVFAFVKSYCRILTVLT